MLAPLALQGFPDADTQLTSIIPHFRPAIPLKFAAKKRNGKVKKLGTFSLFSSFRFFPRHSAHLGEKRNEKAKWKKRNGTNMRNGLVNMCTIPVFARLPPDGPSQGRRCETMRYFVHLAPLGLVIFYLVFLVEF